MADFVWKDGEPQILGVNDASLECMCFGPSPRETSTIILLHEGLGCVDLWRNFPRTLSERTGMGVFAYSRAGYGNSTPVSLPRPMDYMTREAIEVLPVVLDTIGFQRGILLGHSDGATIAATYAGSVEDFRVRGLVVMAPHFFGEQCSWEAIAEARNAYDNGNLREKLGKYHADPDNAFRGWNDAWLNPEFRHWNVSEVIDYFRVPVLAIQGRTDQYGTLAQIDEIENRIYAPLERVILDDCGHSPHLEKPDETLAAITEFAQRLHRIESEPVRMKESNL